MRTVVANYIPRQKLDYARGSILFSKIADCNLADLVLKQPPNDCQPFEEKSEKFIVAANIG